MERRLKDAGHVEGTALGWFRYPDEPIPDSYAISLGQKLVDLLLRDDTTKRCREYKVVVPQSLAGVVEGDGFTLPVKI